MKKIFCYAKANTMKEYRFNDGVAICKADTLEDAINQFLKYYGVEILEGNVSEVKCINCSEGDIVSILTEITKCTELKIRKRP